MAALCFCKTKHFPEHIESCVEATITNLHLSSGTVNPVLCNKQIIIVVNTKYWNQVGHCVSVKTFINSSVYLKRKATKGTIKVQSTVTADWEFKPTRKSFSLVSYLTLKVNLKVLPSLLYLFYWITFRMAPPLVHPFLQKGISH